MVIPAWVDRAVPFSFGQKFPEIYDREVLQTEIFSNGTVGAFHSTKISGNSGPKLNGTVLTNREIFGKEGPPFEVHRFFGRSVLIGNYCSIRKKFGLQYLSVVNFWKFLSGTEWNGSVHSGWYNHPENFPIYRSICHVKFSKFQTGIFGRMESAQ